MKNKLLSLLLLLLLPALLAAQSARLKRANEAMQDLDYMTAIVEYQQVLQREDLPEAKIGLAECYRKINDTENAEYWYGQIVRLPNTKPVNKLYYGMMLQANGKCDVARLWLKQYEKEAPDDARGQFLAKACDMEEELLTKNKGIYQINLLPCNSSFDDFGPSIVHGQLVFASDRDLGTAIKRTSMWTGNPFSDLYSTPLKTDVPGTIASARLDKFSSSVNTRFNEAAVCLAPDGQTLYFTRNNFDDGNTERSEEGLVKLNIFSARRNAAGAWSEVTRLPFNSAEYNSSHPSISPNGKRLYFASNRPGGFGGMDLYFSELNKGIWSAAINLGPTVNTEGNEIFPFIDPNGRLYFASNGHLGLGGLDLFYSTPKGDKDWNLPINLGAPLNSTHDDFGVCFGGDLSWGFFTSDRDGGAGRDDIYAFSKNAAPVEIYVFDSQTRKPISGAAVLNSLTSLTLTTSSDGIVAFDMRHAECADFSTAKKGYEAAVKTGCTGNEGAAHGQITRIEIGLNKLSNFSVQGMVFDMRDGFPANSAKLILTNDCGKTAHEPFQTGPDGRFKFKLDKNCCYTLRAVQDGFIAAVAEGICTKNLTQNPVFKVNLNLEPYRDAEGFIVEIPEKAAANTGPRYNELSGLYENPDGSPATFDLGDGLSVRDGILYDNGAPSQPGESTWERGSAGFLVNLYYDLNANAPNETSMPELKKLLKTLRQNPDFQVEIASHTDSRGSDAYNLELSQRRAENVVEWLVKQGIARERLSPHGYGESKLVNKCGNSVTCEESQHQLNRRTEFRIIGTSGISNSKPQAKPKTAPCDGCPF
ncbi:MAG: PD40 domain-containing protein [Phycisphaerae bacterium]|nr:PD40 domain-containing protein [Saprospiraceae bacterium]